jgi:hypothetical protein
MRVQTQIRKQNGSTILPDCGGGIGTGIVAGPNMPYISSYVTIVSVARVSCVVIIHNDFQ